MTGDMCAVRAAAQRCQGGADMGRHNTALRR